ncbi:alkaline phosphatase family protein [Oceanimonas sp. CHS3-5]|uniref:alkaline phosphatase family protein n=1 Tax=Oceanimonas sp. CHS3-5 TaxID=3068186 RepID=UPI00273DDCF2|nr:alkaline phosphatase family protein [Oceanimonas sp. CHS3-5]MDP5292065.1 alkaline phosphatase family protein [Oceanimonas sp. CHS3-5]
MNLTILAGPLLRRADPSRLVFWLASREELAFRLCLPDREPLLFSGEGQRQLRVGESCFIQLLDLRLDEPLPTDTRLSYDLQWRRPGEQDWHGMAEWGRELCYEGESLPSLVIRSKLDSLLHGSCRKPHHAAPDGLVAADAWLGERHSQPAQRPAQLMLSGDQIYADDVAGPMLTAIHQLIGKLGLYGEELEGALVADSDELFASPLNYYRREQLLPGTRENVPLQKRFFEGARKPIFTTSSAANHLITLAEVLAMYLLVWSPVPWQLLPEDRPQLDGDLAERYRHERERLAAFVDGLPAVRRLLAHMSTLMIFDDHDVTDDWNLTAGWEQSAYGHPFSKRIIGNALAGYLICQGWGNDPDAFAGDPLERLQAWSEQPDGERQDQLIDTLLTFDGWQYQLDTQPRLLVLDTRTRRWRSESSLNRPSGLMDWEALTELQGEMLNQESVVVVSPTPVFGVKLIEVIQKIFTWLGKPLLVDAENWMAHKGTANVILNIFRHARTPANYVILSGDVHYSFMYDIRLRHRGGEPHIWQITSSGIKNEFPRRLLDVLDRLNRWLYAPRSPLNWFTRRRKLRITPHSPVGASTGERLLNRAGIGYVRFNEQGEPVCVQQITAEGAVDFIEPVTQPALVRQPDQGADQS